MFSIRVTTFIKFFFIALIPLSSCSKRIYRTKTIKVDSVAAGIETKVEKDSTTAALAPKEEKQALRLLQVNEVLKKNNSSKGYLGFSALGRAVEAYYFPGKTKKRALVIGGVHGSELSAIEIARSVINQLEKEQSHYSVIVIPCLFPDNAENAKVYVPMIGTASNIGRYTNSSTADPNRQMPSLGKAFSPQNPQDHLGRLIETENQLLLNLISQFRPTRIVNLHAIRNIQFAGIYADPRTDSNGYALGFETDSSLAIDMAKFIYKRGGFVRGNKLDGIPTAKYYLDPPVAKAGRLQVRNLTGSTLPNNRGNGASLGGWATTAVRDSTDGSLNRPAIRLITVEFPGSKRPEDYEDPFEKLNYQNMIDLYASSVRNVFLEGFYVEEKEDLQK